MDDLTPVSIVSPAPNPKPEQKTQEAWEEFLEEDADCCGGCHHKPR